MKEKNNMIKQDSIKDIVQYEGIGLNEGKEQHDRIGQHKGYSTT